MRIYLIGYSYSGKTTLGRELAKRLRYKFFDTDKAIELKYRTTVPVFFNHYGEKAFRIIERQILQSTAEMDNIVVSTGGGTSCNDENIRFITSNGTAIYLKMNPEDILQRAAISHKQRPLLEGKTTEEAREFIKQQLTERMQYYTQAHLTVEAVSVTAEQLMQTLGLSAQQKD